MPLAVVLSQLAGCQKETWDFSTTNSSLRRPSALLPTGAKAPSLDAFGLILDRRSGKGTKNDKPARAVEENKQRMERDGEKKLTNC